MIGGLTSLLVLLLELTASGAGAHPMAAAASLAAPGPTPMYASSDAATIRSTRNASSAPAEVQEITELPGLHGNLLSRQFSGYINVDADHGRHLFYWVVHSEGNLQRDPVILWLTGGPGCSSMDALIYEHGPFTFTYQGDDDITLTENAWSWSKAATMIYVDSPAGAGLSYSDTPSDYVTDDPRTVEDLYTFLQRLLVVMPELQHQDFYLAGESYGGVYVPLLAQKILDMNKDAGKLARLVDRRQHLLRINLKGYMVGNGVADDVHEGNGQWEFAYGMGLIDPATYSSLHQACNGSFWNPTDGSACQQQLKEARRVFYWVNPYDILNACFKKPKRTVQSVSDDLGMPSDRESHARHDHWRAWGPRAWAPHGLGHTVACGDRRAALAWLAKPETRRAIHAVSVDAVPWQPCSDILNYTIPFPVSLSSLHKQLVSQGLRALLYSGDHDFIVPFTGTRSWIYSMQLPTERPYAAWTIEQQVAGFLTVFRPNLMFATIKGAGHMAPQTHPRQSFVLISRFLRDEL